ncbi:UNKNOWN [Stylonychia lemnae]|uniref:Kelch motif family protein n=1 Tax=Stylonychia lemnae TaxID=5949 RepID=A0A078AZE9_STYLE|nr:UNKNOWN [Stylonychia lemnae]|eukprot:CDW87815.1 UNKNOWN [Stylonychia lemnae]
MLHLGKEETTYSLIKHQTILAHLVISHAITLLKYHCRDKDICDPRFEDCGNCASENQDYLYKFTQNMQKEKIWYSVIDKDKCPGNCCPKLDENCRKRLDNTGYPYIPGEQMILIHGGVAVRNKSIGVNKTNLFDYCEDYSAIVGNATFEDIFKNCGEELLNDMWRYYVQRDLWTPIKYDYNRFGHAGVFVQLDDQYTILDTINGTLLRRQFLYIYGGFSFECTSACNDTWRYEIAIGPYAFYPSAKSDWIDAGNFWTKLSQEGSNNPGKRFRHNMISYQKFKDDYNLVEEHFLYLFGGIQWEQVEQYGISGITRQIYLWNNSAINQPITTDELTQDDKYNTNIQTRQANNVNDIKRFNIQIPSARGGHAMTLVGNPLEYIMVFGGSTAEVISSEDVSSDFQKSNSSFSIKKTLKDMWVFYVKNSLWNQVFPNSDDNPQEREFSTLVTVKADRLVLLYGGQYGEKLYKDVWQYNLNTNMQNCEDCYNCTSPLGPNVYTNLTCDYCATCVQGRYQDCVTCTNCSDCINSTLADSPDGYKGHVMVATKSGIVIYGGASWISTNLDETDTIEEQKEKFLERCRTVLAQRTGIEQENSQSIGEKYAELTIDDMGNERWVDQFRKTNNKDIQQWEKMCIFYQLKIAIQIVVTMDYVHQVDVHAKMDITVVDVNQKIVQTLCALQILIQLTHNNAIIVVLMVSAKMELVFAMRTILGQIVVQEGVLIIALILLLRYMVIVYKIFLWDIAVVMNGNQEEVMTAAINFV